MDIKEMMYEGMGWIKLGRIGLSWRGGGFVNYLMVRKYRRKFLIA
jgi:hypothetical protein